MFWTKVFHCQNSLKPLPVYIIMLDFFSAVNTNQIKLNIRKFIINLNGSLKEGQLQSWINSKEFILDLFSIILSGYPPLSFVLRTVVKRNVSHLTNDIQKPNKQKEYSVSSWRSIIIIIIKKSLRPWKAYCYISLNCMPMGKYIPTWRQCYAFLDLVLWSWKKKNNMTSSGQSECKAPWNL